MSTLESDIESLWNRHETESLSAERAGREELSTLDAFLDALEDGSVRAAHKRDGEWVANEWVKRGILLNFVCRAIDVQHSSAVDYHDVLGLRSTDDLPARGTRNTPDGTVIRRGAAIGSDAILMSPAFVNVGAHVGDGTLIDSCDTVGSCAQIGANVKLGANTLIGGVLEPVESAPVIVENDVAVGAGCRITSGFVVGEGCVIGENTLLTPRIPVYDLVDEEIYYGHLPPERRAFTRFVESSVGEHDLFDGGAFKPAVVATDIEATTLSGTEREALLRS
ncbi:2,3,4,5-tetrahydropyridine-2,6-dicarboxylate N-succinyltransferase [Halocatena halophila]|uniref:2,3,4,5-tetrahydropyridine-2,6-dicarboxylate N-succinyltransferase n=1 Tax=Halocatena halophila TaxID=2814576 RepID=UPI002ED4273B